MIINPYRFAAADAGIKTDLVGWWDLEETGTTADRLDATANNLDMTVTGSILGSTGKIGTAAEAVTSSDSLTRPDEALTSITGDMTIAGWINIDNNSALFTILSKSLATGNQRSYILYAQSSQFKFLVNVDGNSGASNTIVTSTTTASTSTWYFVCGVYKAGDDVDLWVNGTKEVSAGSAPASLHDGTAPLEMFSLNDGQPNGIGLLDSVGLWSRALSDAEIATLYNSGSGVAYADL